MLSVLYQPDTASSYHCPTHTNTLPRNIMQRDHDHYERIQGELTDDVFADNVVSSSILEPRQFPPQYVPSNQVGSSVGGGIEQFQQQRSSLELLATIARMSSTSPADRSSSRAVAETSREGNNNSKWLENSRSLGFHFVPGYFDVICGRGKSTWNHTGNKFFRALVKHATGPYSKARTKAERSVIVSEIIDTIRSRGTGFVKQDESDGEWIEVGDLLAREKVGQMLRNALAGRYRSSITSKKRRRRDVQVTRLQILHKVMETNKQIHQNMVTIKESTETAKLSEADLMAIFAQNQADILANIKKDRDLVDRFHQAEKTSSSPVDDDDSTVVSADSDGDVEMKSGV